MATVAALPPTLRAKIDAVVRHIRILRAVRGISALLLVLTLVGGLALLADAVLTLPWMVRIAMLATWAMLGGVLTVFGVILPLLSRLDPQTIAAVVEEKYPYLGERLTTSVELAGDNQAYHGSPAFIALLIHETEARTSRLDFLGAVPARFVWTMASVAAIVIFLVAAPAVVFPSQYSELTQRFFAPTPPVEVAPFDLVVTTKADTAAIGRQLTLSAVAKANRDDVDLPANAFLVIEDGQKSAAPGAHDRPGQHFLLRSRQGARQLRLSL